MPHFFLLAAFFFIHLASPSDFLPGQQKPQEEVTVTAVEVPVRVLKGGKALKGLNKEDFEIYENGVLKEITAFEFHSRKISALKDASQEIVTAPEKRLFILIFNIFDYTPSVEEAINHFFQNIFSPGDTLVIFTENRLLNIERGKNLSEMVSKLKETLKKYKIISTAATYKAFTELRYEADRLLAALRGEISGGSKNIAVSRFFENYLTTWLNYKKQYLTPDVELYRNAIERISQIEGEKWAICFQQRDMFPKLKNESRLEKEIQVIIDDPEEGFSARTIQSRMWELQRSFDMTENFPVEALKNLFQQANITFHLILLKSLRLLQSQDFEMGEVAQDYENYFKKICSATGGSTTFSNNVSEALKEAAEIEDQYYLLVYSPKENESPQERKIEVKVKRPDVDLVYLKHFPGKENPSITISGFESQGKAIKFSLANYKMARINGKTSGIAEVKITLFDESSNKVFDEGKTLDLVKQEIHISLNFSQLKEGSHFIVIQAVDKIENKVAVFSGMVDFK